MRAVIVFSVGSFSVRLSSEDLAELGYPADATSIEFFGATLTRA